MRRKKPVSPEAKAAAAGERLPLTKQQAASVIASQAALGNAQDAANLVIRGIYDAAGIDDAEVVGGNVGEKDPHLMIKRKASK